MIDFVGKKVLIILYDKTTISGIVLSWSNSMSIIKDDDDNHIVIHNTSQDVFLTKIIVKTTIKKFNDLKEKQEEIVSLPIENPERLDSLADCRIALINQEKKIISESLKSHYPSGGRKIQYEQPRLYKK